MKSMCGLVAGALLLCATFAASADAEKMDAATHDKVAAHVADLTRKYFELLAVYDLAGMRAMSTPEFEIMEHNGEVAMLMGLDAFDERLKGAQAAGAQILFDPQDIRATVTRDAAWVMYVEHGAGPNNQGSRFYGTMIFKRAGDSWLLDKMYSVPIPEGSPNFPK